MPIRFVSMVIESTSSLNNAIISFLIMSSFGPFALSIAASPSFLYKATLLLSVIVRYSLISWIYSNYLSLYIYIYIYILYISIHRNPEEDI